MNFSYQMIAVQGALVGAAFIVLYTIMGAPILKLKESKLEEEVKLLKKQAKKEKSTDSTQAKEDSATEESNVIVMEPRPEPVVQTTTANKADGPIYYRGMWYADASVASKYEDQPVDLIAKECSDSQNGIGLWDPNGQYDVAHRHRRLVVDGRKRISLVVSDYKVSERSDKTYSRGFLVRGHQRTKIDVADQETDHNTVSFFKEAAKAQLLAQSA